MTERYYTRFETRFCGIFLVSDGRALVRLHLDTDEGKRHFSIGSNWQRNDDIFTDIRIQIEEYCCGERKTFAVALAPEGTVFQRRVWDALCRIPYGSTCSYRDIARMIGKPTACRAVGAANGKNPIPLIIPCHRVIGADGSLTGFSHGLVLKKRLLELEYNHKS